MTHVLVDKTVLDRLLRKAWGMFELLAEESGYAERYLEPDSELVTLAVQAGLLIPGPLNPGTVPPAPPARRFRGGTTLAPVYRAPDGRLRCSEDAKVVYGTKMQAGFAARDIGPRQQMKVYNGSCGHWHLATVRKEGVASRCGTVFKDG